MKASIPVMDLIHLQETLEKACDVLSPSNRLWDELNRARAVVATYLMPAIKRMEVEVTTPESEKDWSAA